MRVVLDASVLVAAFATRGLCPSVLESCVSGHHLFMSDALMEETQKALERRVKLPVHIVRDIVAFLAAHTTRTEPVLVDPISCRDPHDLHVLGLAVGAQVQFVVTGDQDLLVLKRFNEVLIVSPRDFWNHLQQQKKII